MIVYAKRDWVDHPEDRIGTHRRKIRRPMPKGTKEIKDLGKDPASVMIWTARGGMKVIAKGTFAECQKIARKLSTKLAREPFSGIEKVGEVE